MASFNQLVTERLAAITAKLNAIATNAKRIFELPSQNTLVPTSLIHVDNNGTSESLEVQKIIDAVVSGKYDQLISIGEIILDENEVTVPANATWKISDVFYSNISDIVIEIPYCATGFQRKDILVANTSNDIVLVQGEESDGGVIVRPNIPVNTVLVTEMDVTDSSVGEPEIPVTGDDYVKKAEAGTRTTSDDGVVDFGGNFTRIDLTDATELHYLAFDDNPYLYDGKPFWIFNKNVDELDLTIFNLSGGTTGRFSIPSGNMVLSYGEGASFKLAMPSMILDYVGITPATNTQVKNSYFLNGYGDSLMGGAYTTDAFGYTLAKNTGLRFFNFGVGGETSTQIKNRFIADSSNQKYPFIILAGTNNHTVPAIVLADIAEMVAYAGHNRYLILSIVNNSSEISGTAGHTEVLSVNSSLSSVYGTRYLDIRTALINSYNPLIPQDVIDFGNDIPPSSLRLDNVHFNDKANLIIANLLATKINLLQPETKKLFSVDEISELFKNPPSIGGGSYPIKSDGYFYRGFFGLHDYGDNRGDYALSSYGRALINGSIDLQGYFDSDLKLLQSGSVSTGLNIPFEISSTKNVSGWNTAITNGTYSDALLLGIRSGVPIIGALTVANGLSIMPDGGITTIGNANLTGTPTAPTPTTSDGIANKSYVDGLARPYKVYTALLTQSGTTAPTAIVLENTLGGTVSFSYSAVGSYTATVSGSVLTSGKTLTSLLLGNSTAAVRVLRASRLNGTTVNIQTWDSTVTLANDVINSEAIFEIRVYN